MKRNIIITTIIVFLLVFISCYIIVINKKPEPIVVINANLNGNDTNNIIYGENAALQDDWIYEGRPEGLFKRKTDGSKLRKLDSGNIHDVNVIGEWVYYVKLEKDESETRIIFSPSLYKIKINGTDKTFVKKYVSNVNVINNKMFYIKGPGIFGDYNENEVQDFDFSYQDAIATCDMDGNNEIVLINDKAINMVTDGKYIYYQTYDNKVYSYDIESNHTKYLFETNFHYYILADDGIIFFDYGEHKIKMYDFKKEKVTILIKDIEDYGSNVMRLYIYNGTLYYEIKGHLYLYNFTTHEIQEVDKECKKSCDIYFFQDRIFFYNENGINEIKL